jgi:hypothetical protein
MAGMSPRQSTPLDHAEEPNASERTSKGLSEGGLPVPPKAHREIDFDLMRWQDDGGASPPESDG